MVNGPVYIIDDEAMIRNSLQFMLASKEIGSLCYDSASKFLQDAPTLPAGFVLLDVRMPEMDGIELLRSLTPHLHRYEITVMTGHGDTKTAVEAMKLGASDFIEKPFDSGELINSIKSGLARLEKRRSRHEEKVRCEELIANLTDTQLLVLRHLMAGLSNKETGRLLNLSPRTVEMHRSNLLERLGGSLAHAIRVACVARVEPAEDVGERAFP